MSSAEALKSVTAVKHSQLEDNFKKFNEFHQNLLKSIENKTPSEQLEILLDKCSKPSSSFDIGDLIKRIEALYLFSKGTSFSSDAKIEAWCLEILDSLNVESEKYKYTRLFYKLIYDAVEENPESSDKQKNAKAEMAEQLAQFKQFVFSEGTGDAAAIKTYLNDELFSNSSSQLDKMRSSVTSFCNWLFFLSISESDVISTIKNLMASGLVDNDNVTILRGFIDNKIIVKEIADVLTVKLKSISSWSWPEEGLLAVQKRQLNGKYRVYAHSDLIDSIFLHFIGVTWSVKLREIFVDFTDSKNWKKNDNQKFNDRKEFYFGECSRADVSIDNERSIAQKERFLLTQLATSRDDGLASGYDCSDENDSDSDSCSASQKLSIGELKQNLLRILVTELELSKAFDRPHVIVRSDFKWFGPSLSHNTIFSVMEFFGVTEEWLDFFRKFLAIPIKFSDTGDLRVRTRGTPMSYALSHVFGESVLFLLDFAVNQYGDGLFLYRLHDDFWLWHHDQKLMTKVWKQMNRFNKIFGLEFNEEKTGSKTIGANQDADLPVGNGIKWGLLELTESGKLMIDQKSVDLHIEELRRQLDGTTDVLNWVKAYNLYVKYLVNNFGDLSANLSGYHLDDMIETLTRINNEVFNENSPVGHLKKVLAERYSATDLVEGWFYQSAESGGLDLCDLRIFLQLMKTEQTLEDMENRRNNIKPRKALFALAAEEDWVTYEALRTNFFNNSDPESNEKFSVQEKDYPTFEFYLNCRENWIKHWANDYIKSTSEALYNYYQLPRSSKAVTNNWLTTDNHKAAKLSDFNVQIQNETIQTLYGEEMNERWGQESPVFEKFKPLGLVQMWKKERTEWIE